ncbi:ParB/RepB/Spo0J family partition protein [Pseudonocardia sp. KRD291]|uniref:ParB/RepB/Spo0J family partition protein n=1 Tax=Pseudonocardia sp. KRD291 TaxID=2792007 RepID=UPI001C4A248B|nr:ParB/RepB/Spo0J family partition protein [Pseudonocardia sp. KRD291]MBW0105805.1 ParB/RepB/Spo0J family partition protein [Pseudonocardia sp. KRD291]
MAHPTSLRLDEAQANPQNPRYEHDDPEVKELAETLSRVGQLQPAVVVAREQYLQVFPEQTGHLGPAPWVVIVGNRRLAAARVAGRSALEVRVAADLDTPEAFEDRILIENLQRKDLPPLLEAEHLRRRLAREGETFRSVGEAIGKSHTYVQQRVELLKLIPEFQALLRDGYLPIKTGRRLGGLPDEDQRARLAAGPPYLETQEPAATGAARGNPVATPTPQPGPAESGNQVANEPATPVRATGAGRAARTPAPVDPEQRLATTTLDVLGYVDNALGALDRVLPDGGDGHLGQVLAESQRHLSAAREVLARGSRPA